MKLKGETTTMETKELSIKIIKNEIIDKLINDISILQYLEAERLINEGHKIPDLRNGLIYDYDIGYLENYISVEVIESDSSTSTNIDDKKYTVIIKMSIRDESKICDMSSEITDIVDKLYPSRKNFKNTFIRTIDNFINIKNDERLHRIITFEV